MPKQIKSPKLGERQRKNARIGLLVLGAAFGLGGAFIAFLHLLGREGANSAPAAIAVACLLVLLLGFSLWHCIQGFLTYEKEEDYGVLLTSVLTAFSAFTAIVNARFGTALFLSGAGLEDALKSVIGDRSFDEFIAMQRTAWLLLIAGIGAAFITGMISSYKLGKNSGK